MVVVLVGALALVFLGRTEEADAGAAEATIEYPDEWDARVEPLAEWVADTRDLAFSHPVEVEFLTEDEYRARAEGTDDESDEAEAILADQLAVMRALGLISGDVDLDQASSDLSSGGTLAYYDFTTKRVTVRGTELTPALRVTLVHELTHVLQDQRFDLGRLTDPDFENGDTLRALAEGDAGRIEDIYAEQELTDEERTAYEEESEGQAAQADEDLADVPPALVALFSAPYILGEGVVDYHEVAAGADAIDALLESPPSAQELLDPALRDTAAAEVVEVEVDVPDGAEVIDGPTSFGPVVLYLMLASVSDPTTALVATDGWGGDEYVAYREDDDDVCVGVAVRGDDAAASDRLRDALTVWAGASPSETSIAADGDVVRFTSCDPGAEATESAAVTPDLFAVPATRTAIETIVIEAGGSRMQAECSGQAVIDVLTFEEMSDPDLGAGAEVQQKVTDAMVGCR